jgi:flagellar hook protein FlgE
MSFGIALSGLDAAQSNLNVTANNIANSATTGFKSSNANFAELFAVSPQGVSDTQIGSAAAADRATVLAGRYPDHRQ